MKIEPWKVKSDKIDYNNGFFEVHVRQSVSPITGKEHPFYILSTRDWVNIIALTDDGKIPMVYQYRHGSGEMSLEIPGGAVDKEDGHALEGAKRELLEETGYEAREWHSLGQIRPNPAILDNTCHIYLALGAIKVSDLDLDEAEELEVRLHDLPEVKQMIQQGKLQHALVIAAFQLFDLFQKSNPQVFKNSF
jgi:8-oxo-dGTP pyrophosphatase MutT (NUDIX family)